jgi:serine/threonine protein phosphatase PrpC
VRGQDEGQEGQKPNGHLLAIPLSRDQTPYRKDERERVKNSGATVMSIDQLEGHEPIHEDFGDLVLGEDVDYQGDPPRVWVKGKNYPGCAFTRSLGDGLAEDIGVTAEPEILCRSLTVNDEILVIASDGIFEFLTNQQVLEMVQLCGSAFKACKCLVEAAYNQWLTYERRTDDITIIICFLKCSMPVPETDVEGTTEDLVEFVKSTYGTKPVRRPRNSKDTLCRPAASSISLPSGTVLDI